MQKSKTTLLWLSLISFSIATTGCTGKSNIEHTNNDDSNSITQISNGMSQTCLLKAGQVYCWGSHFHGALGDGIASTSPADSDEDILYPSSPIKSIDASFISADNLYTIVIGNNGQLYGWGTNRNGQLAQQESGDFPSPVLIAFAGKVMQLATGPSGAFIIDQNNQLYSWGGYNIHGQLGNGTIDLTHTQIYPITAIGSRISFKKIGSTNGYTTCAISTDGQPYCWGSNVHGELGIANHQDVAIPTKINMPAPVQSITEISTGEGHVCAISDKKSLYCWGDNQLGQLGIGNNTQSDSPVLVSPKLKFINVTAVGGLTCAISDSYDLYCWGQNSSGTLGDGKTITSSTPIKIAVPGESFKDVSAYNAVYQPGKYPNNNDICATTRSGKAYCWGYNGYGVLGNGTKTIASEPTLVKFST